MFVCICNQVTDTQIREACQQGACSVECLQSELKVASCCGRCKDCANKIIQDEQLQNISMLNSKPINHTATQSL